MKTKLIILLVFVSGAMHAQVKVYEGKETIPTYKLGPNIKSPIFYTGRGVQGAAGHMYPYPAQTSLGDVKTMETYEMVYLENEYLKVTILPAFGGRLFSAIDKTNGHELFHVNSAIKPDLIGTLGAWISGGIEWCFPHHHRTTTLMPVDFMMVENDDGSATVWIGETERDQRLRGIIGITLRPGRSFIETEYRLNNTTEVTRNFLFWANVAVTADENFRTFWPPSQEIGVFHSNTSFTEWPISHQNYRGIDYTAGVDLTWWKNHPDPVSFFYWQGKEGFVGGYDYAMDAGTIHVGNIIENKTSKLWQFGPGLQGQNARRKLTDDGKAYVELMTGTFSNNQPGYAWFAPNEVKQAKNYWYPIRDLEIVKKASTEASTTLQLRDPKNVFYGFNTTKEHQHATALLKRNGEVLEEHSIDIDPSKPFTSTFKSQYEMQEEELSVELRDEEGKVIISYDVYQAQHPELPPVQEAPKRPHEIETVEDLYLAGRFVEQFSRPGVNPDDYYIKALGQSPDDYRVNIAMGIRRLKQWKYQEAEEYLHKAADKLKVNYFQPKEGELFYYLAIAQLRQGKIEEAYLNFAQSTWYHAWQSAGYYQLALMESREGDYAKAFELVEKAYSSNNHDGRIIWLYSALSRKLGKTDLALELTDKLINFDPINFAARYENGLARGNASLLDFHRNMQDLENNYLDIAMHYMNAEMFEEGIQLLASLENVSSPLVNYYLAWFYAQTSQPHKAREELANAGKQSIDYCFPYRWESEKVVRYAINEGSNESQALYLLGNLLYDRRPEDAVKAWEDALDFSDEVAMVRRNLAFAAFHYEDDIDKAIALLESAIAKDASHAQWYGELAEYYDHAEQGFETCLQVMTENLEVVKQDLNAPKSLVKLYNLSGNYDDAIELLSKHHFRTWEGGRVIYHHHVDAHCLKALELIDAGKIEMAIQHLHKAMEYPENLEVGKPLNDERNAMMYYYLGLANERLGKKGKAKDWFQKSVLANNSRSWPDLIYYQGMAHQKLGNEDQARECFNNLVKQGERQLTRGKVASGIGVEDQSSKANTSISEAYYLKALGFLGLDRNNEVEELLQAAQKAYPNNLWARYHLQQMN